LASSKKRKNKGKGKPLPPESKATRRGKYQGAPWVKTKTPKHRRGRK